MSGYEIRKEAAASIGHFWSESYGQIYPALRELAAAGLARSRTERASGRPERHVFEITPAGTEALRRWLVEPPRPVPVRNELLLKLFFGDATSIPVHIEWIERLLAQETERRRHYADLRRQLMREQRRHPSLPFWLITLSFGEQHAESLVQWSRKTLARLEAGRKTARRASPRVRRRVR
jgi:DNA-binding PadR family transcriptional regulator